MATSMAFCKDGSPVQALLAALRRLLICSCGLPVQEDNDERLYLTMCLHLFCVLRNCSAIEDLQLLKHATKIFHTLT